mmetsp:Transcript_27701/g.38277  ORF Transcript_27701/g.38277 Transcript_27701/m.38277 type:complete len:237 (+) Transcript_27701:187-897(+)|eukprot:CAMPEP_0196579314 /NCGR_PEP_ID=MMETSP1081-20130531/20001_1 /TAXON_ID=36882 /ORGANISM="Pyramimonas amylifera, Strain CCMP720" /LENGTH=236 /DNA_ID=CAMNT_0041898849 /DNA_START=181 /DNA_END=891 /DNA_ORIENTATION=+
MSGRGRGRGRGKPQHGPIARDDEGNVLIPTGPSKPPLRFPEHSNMPPLPTLSEREQHLLLRRRKLLSSYRGSAYFIEQKLDDVTVDVERYSDRYTGASRKRKADRPSLQSVMTLSGAHFPLELIGAKQMKAGRGRSAKGAMSFGLNNNKASEDLLKLDELASLERRYADDEEKKEGSGRALKVDGDGDADAEEDEVEEEMEEDEYEDDDYMQGCDYDDDDGYDDDGGGGDDDDAVF